ncbi:MAG: Holliday junction resolvase RuvX [Marinilabiliales bacterium]|jgi:putative Holliday junction resolvase|nr:MAG: Holliday junction resolvase RuvX [Marinilabiliales bacterium]
MGRILAIDYGQKRVGVAATDELQITSNGIDTVRTVDIWQFLEDFLKDYDVDAIVVGEPKDMMNQPSDASRFIEPFVKKLVKKYPRLKVERFDERFTSKMAFDAMIEGGLSKKKRQNKALVDKVSATLLLQSYLSSKEIRK